jgi:hypothetical protein
MTFWVAVVVGIGVVAVCGAVGWRQIRRRKQRSQDPQNLYPLW